MFELVGILKGMWQGFNWQELSESGKLGFGVAGILACLGGVIVIASLTVLIGSGQMSLLLASGEVGKISDEIVLAGDVESMGLDPGEIEGVDSANQLVIDVSGAVNSPGLYELPSGSRLGKSVEAAGGFAPKADVVAIARDLNLASVLQDGQKIYIPFQSESITQVGSGGSITQVVGDQATGLVSINKASQAELMELEGIGEKRAEAIIAGRPYSSLDQLVSEGALTAGVLGKIQDLLEL